MCHLKKTLYGPKQSPRIWYTKIASFLKSQGYKATNANHVVFIKTQTIVAIYVNNLLLVGLDINLIDSLKKKLNQIFKMTDLGPCQYYLEIQIIRNQSLGTIHFDQTEYVKQFLQTFQMTDSKPMTMPIELRLNLPPLDKDPLDSKLQLQYQMAIGVRLEAR